MIARQPVMLADDVLGDGRASGMAVGRQRGQKHDHAPALAWAILLSSG